MRLWRQPTLILTINSFMKEGGALVSCSPLEGLLSAARGVMGIKSPTQGSSHPVWHPWKPWFSSMVISLGWSLWGACCVWHQAKPNGSSKRPVDYVWKDDFSCLFIRLFGLWNQTLLYLGWPWTLLLLGCCDSIIKSRIKRSSSASNEIRHLECLSVFIPEGQLKQIFKM